MQNEKIVNILKGQPCSLSNIQIMELGGKCSSQGYSLERVIQIGKTLFKNDSQTCYKFLQYVEKNQLTRNIHKDFVHQPWKIQIYYSLASLSLGKALKQNDKQSSQKWQKQFNKYLNLGSKSSTQKLYQLLHGFNSYYGGDFGKAIANFNSLDQKDHQVSTIALLGLAQCYFMLRKYQSSLQHYKKALISNKNLPPKARLGMAYCFFQLQKYQLSQKCFKRIITLEPKCVQAYVGLAVINYRKGNYQVYFENIRKGYDIQSNDPLIVLHLCEHYLFIGQYGKCRKLSQKGLEYLQGVPKFLKKELPHRDDYQVMKARFNNLIGQVYHAQGEYEQAKKYYEKANNRGLKFNSITLAQTLIHGNMLKQSLKIFQEFFTTGKITELKLIADFYKTVAYLQVKIQVKPSSSEHSPNNYYKQALKYNKNDYDTLIDYSVLLSEINDKKQALKILQNALKSLQTTNKQPKVQLLNNIAVYMIEQKQYQQAKKILKKALIMLAQSSKTTIEDQLRYHALYLTVSFNLAVALEMNHKYSDAIQIHQNLISFNRFYVDSYVRLADVYYQLGQRQKGLQLLQTGIQQCSKIKQNQMRVDKLLVMKAHLYHIDGSNSQSKQCFRRLGNSRFHYQQFYQMCLGYESVIKKQLDIVLLKDFLRPNRQSCIQICGSDPSNLHSFMVLIVLFLTDGRITKEQGIKYFNQLKIAEEEFPEVLYNFGVFSMLNQDYQNALFCLERFKEKNKGHQIDQYIALVHLLKGNFSQCLNMIKKNILMEPQNLKYRYQYAYTKQKRIQKLYEEEKNFKDLKLSSKNLAICKKIYESLSKISTNDYLRTVNTADMKQRLKNQIIKLRQACQCRDRYVQSQLGYYGKKQKQIIDKQRRIKQDQMKKLQQIKKIKQNKYLLYQMAEDADQSDSQKLRKQRRKKLMELSIQESQRANEQWKLLQEQYKLNQGEQKKKRRNNNEGRKQKKQKHGIQEKQEQEQEEEDYLSEEQYKDQEDEIVENGEDENEEVDREKQEKKKKKKKKKNKEKQEENNSKDKRKMRKKKKKNGKHSQQHEQAKNGEQHQQKSELHDKKNQSENQSDPFEQVINQAEINNKQEEQLKSRQKPQKKKKNNKNDDDSEISIQGFLIK